MTVLVSLDKSVNATTSVKLINSVALPNVKLLPLEVPTPALFSTAVNVATQNLGFESVGLAVGGVVCQPVSSPVNAPVPKVKVALLSAAGPAGALAEPALK